jgi:hypothetical protein
MVVGGGVAACLGQTVEEDHLDRMVEVDHKNQEEAVLLLHDLNY